jgi:hypothetical protein
VLLRSTTFDRSWLAKPIRKAQLRRLLQTESDKDPFLDRMLTPRTEARA